MYKGERITRKNGVYLVVYIWYYGHLGFCRFRSSGSRIQADGLFGIFVLAASTAIGGGIIRDLMLGHTPPIALQSSLYFFLIIAAMLGTTAMIRYFDAHIRSQVMHHSAYIYLAGDTIGLGLFYDYGNLVGVIF